MSLVQPISPNFSPKPDGAHIPNRINPTRRLEHYLKCMNDIELEEFESKMCEERRSQSEASAGTGEISAG